MSAGDWKDMFLACQNDDLDLVKHHIRNGVNPNYQHPEYLTSPLIECIRLNHLEIAAYLVSKGADPSLKEGFGSDTALSIAKSAKNKAALALFKNPPTC